MKLSLLVLVGLLAGSVFAQSANVIELSPADSARAQKAWDALQKAQIDWATIQQEIKKKYVDQQALVYGEHTKIQPHDGFENGFEFSKDFRFIVPKAPEQKPTQIYSPYILNGVANMDCSKGPC